MYRFTSDPGHGWLHVPVKEILALGIAHKISPSSYVSPKGHTVFLEEDDDLSTFVRAKFGLLEHEAPNADTDHFWRTQIKSTHTDRRSRIRNMPAYRPELIGVQNP